MKLNQLRDLMAIAEHGSLIYHSDAPLLPTAAHFATLLRRHAQHVGRRHPGLNVKSAGR